MKPEQRPDFSRGLIHFTRKRIGKTRHFENDPGGDPLAPDEIEIPPIEVLSEILRDGFLRGSNNKGFIKGTNPAVCFSEVPLASVRYFAALDGMRYSVYGIAISKQAAFQLGARPVIYLPDNEGEWIPPDQKWRHVRFEHGNVDFTHEREWRLPGDLDLAKLPGFYLLVWDPSDSERFNEITNKYKNIRGTLPLKHILQLL